MKYVWSLCNLHKWQTFKIRGLEDIRTRSHFSLKNKPKVERILKAFNLSKYLKKDTVIMSNMLNFDTADLFVISNNILQVNIQKLPSKTDWTDGNNY
jgi:hypothetical protein